MRDNNAIDHVGSLSAKHFYRDDHRAIFAEISQTISQGKQADVITVWEALQGHTESFLDGLLPYLNQIVQNTPSATNVARYADIVVDSALLRALLQVTARASELAQNPQGNSADQVLDTV